MCKEMLFTKNIDVIFLTFSIIISHTVKQVIVYLNATAEDKFSICIVSMQMYLFIKCFILKITIILCKQQHRSLYEIAFSL